MKRTLNSGLFIREISIMPKKSGQTAMAQSSISAYTSRVTRRTARVKTTTLDVDNENIVSIATSKDCLLKSPKRLQKSISVQESSPAKISRKTAEVKEVNISVLIASQCLTSFNWTLM